MSDLDKNKIASLNGLLQICREKMKANLMSIHFDCCLSNIQFLSDVDNKIKIIDCYEIEESDIPILMQFLASPRADGQQRVMLIRVQSELQKALDAIKEEFHTSTQPIQQPFYLQFRAGGGINNILQSEEQNAQTHETLTIVPNPRDWSLNICRHPRGQYEQWAEDAGKRLNAFRGSTTFINVDISEFGISMDSI